jgi:L-rhamnose-H+ transport protein
LVALPAGEPEASLPMNWAMAMATGLFWYGQFFFYNLGHVRMGSFKFTSWAIHMIMLVLISNVVGILLREWRQCRTMTRRTIGVALVVLIVAVLLLTYGNRVGELSNKKDENESASVLEDWRTFDLAQSSNPESGSVSPCAVIQ